MIPARRPAPRLPPSVSALIAIAIVPALFLLLAWSSVANQLEYSSRNESVRDEAAGVARRWTFEHADALVLPGSVGVELARFGSSGMSLTLPDGEADLSLRTRARPIALEALAGARLSLSGDAPLSVRLIAQTGDASEYAAPASNPTASADGSMRLPIPQTPPGQSATSLRLHLSTAPGATLQLHSLELLPGIAARASACLAQDSVPATLTLCGIGPGIIQLPVLPIPERLLAFADALQARSLATVRVPGSSIAVQRALDIAASSRFALAATGLALLVGVLLIGSLIAHRGMPVQEVPAWSLGLIAAPVALLWLGIPRDSPDATAMPLAAWLAVLLLLPRAARTWQWLGNRAAWIAALRFCLVALLLISLPVVYNAMREGALELHAADLDKIWIYPLWAAFQQYLLIAVIGPRTRALSAAPLTAAICAGAIFGLLHLPNFSLMLFTFAAGSAWAWQGFRHRALLPLIVSHAVLGASLMLFAPSWLMRSAEIGGRFLMPP